jgi:DNA replication protein DnaC
MKIKELDKPKFRNVKMMCDDVIDSKLEEYEAIKTCFSKHNFSIIAGKMGQGKTSLTINLIRNIFKKIFHEIYVIIPEISLQSISEKDNIFMKYLNDEDHLYHEYSSDVLDTIYDKLQENSNNGYNSLLVIDDMGSQFKTNKLAEATLNKIIIKMRHLKTSVFLLGQNIYQMPKKWREVCTNLITFNLGKSQMEKIFNEFYDIKKEQFTELMKLFTNPHDYLVLCLKHQRIFYNWDEVILDEE